MNLSKINRYKYMYAYDRLVGFGLNIDIKKRYLTEHFITIRILKLMFLFFVSDLQEKNQYV
jgi:hypothetical protein